MDTWTGCTPDGKPPIVGQRYKVTHSRKGTFKGVVLGIDDPFFRVRIDAGKAGAILPENEKDVGETVDCRNSLCRIVPI